MSPNYPSAFPIIESQEEPRGLPKASLRPGQSGEHSLLSNRCAKASIRASSASPSVVGGYQFSRQPSCFFLCRRRSAQSCDNLRRPIRRARCRCERFGSRSGAGIAGYRLFERLEPKIETVSPALNPRQRLPTGGDSSPPETTRRGGGDDAGSCADGVYVRGGRVRVGDAAGRFGLAAVDRLKPQTLSA